MDAAALETYPLLLLQDITLLNEKFAHLAYINSDIISFNEFNGVQLSYYDEKRRFSYILKNPILDSNTKEPKYSVSYTPANHTDFNTRTIPVNLTNALAVFDTWLKLVRQYKEVKLKLIDPFVTEYEKEFTEYFNIVDEDADTKPYEHQKQLDIYRFLDVIQSEIKLLPPNAQTQELIVEANDLQDNLSSLPKRKVAEKFISILAKAKKYSLKFFFMVVDVAIKEGIKEGLKYGAHEYLELLQTLSQHPKLIS